MKVRVTVTLDVDPDAWELTYGIPRAECRADVLEHAKHTLVETYRDLGMLRDGAA